MQVFDPAGRRYELAATGAAGGEGTIYRVASAPSLAAKIFHSERLTPELVEKLNVMIRSAPHDASYEARRHRSLIWPVSLAYSDPHRQRLVGYVMPWIDTKVFRQAHTYYDPSDRIRRFGGLYTWRHLMIAACNLSSAVAAVHAQGHAVGDLRDTNILLAPNSLVSIIDCDSFQIVDPNSSKVFRTRVGSGEFLPPELQGADLSADWVDRSASDLFALAVLVFKFLMLGVHPNQARGEAMSELPSIEAKIKAGVYAFGGRPKGASPPEFAPSIGVLPHSLRKLCDRAFLPRNAHERPSGKEWFDALNSEGPRLKRCRRNINHLFGGHLRSCPWCGMSRDPFPPAPNIGGQVAASSPNGAASFTDRNLHLSSHIEMALVDGGLSDEELIHIRRLGEDLGLRRFEIDRLIKQSESKMKPIRKPAAAAHSPAPKASVSTAQPPKTRSLEELRALLAAHPEPDKAQRPRLRAAIGPSTFALSIVAIGSLLPLLTTMFVLLVLTPALACVSEIKRDRTRGEGWVWITSKMLTRAPQAIVQSIYFMIPPAMYAPLPLAGIYAGLVGALGLHPPTVFRWLGATAAGWFVLWILFLTQPEPFVRDVRSGVRSANQAIGSKLGSRLAGPMLIGVVAVICVALGIEGHTSWWPLPDSPL